MFDAFQARYPRDSEVTERSGNTSASSPQSLADFVSQFGGASFGGGLYRVISTSDLGEWKARIGEGFPEFADRTTCFAYDWLGRVFALDPARLEGGQPGVVMLEPGTGEALEIPCNWETFHTEELLEYGEAALAISFYEKWLGSGGAAPTLDQCVGYKKPLFLGGVDDLENLELSALDVYWHLSTQIIRQTRGLPPRTPVRFDIG
ncbi:MAG: DUF1851 domain-containing protein [Ponticaulis sp.]|nr:DUF1851 domain-containing protein [Ponticaulis sp.]